MHLKKKKKKKNAAHALVAALGATGGLQTLRVGCRAHARAASARPAALCAGTRSRRPADSARYARQSASQASDGRRPPAASIARRTPSANRRASRRSSALGTYTGSCARARVPASAGLSYQEALSLRLPLLAMRGLPVAPGLQPATPPGRERLDPTPKQLCIACMGKHQGGLPFMAAPAVSAGARKHKRH